MESANILTRFYRNHPLMCWMGFILICLLPIIILRDFTPANELRYISIADEALRNGHWFTLTNNGEPYSDKPPFYFWLIMIVKILTGSYPMGILILFSLVPAFGICYTMYQWCRDEMGTDGHSLLPLLLITTGYFAGTALVLRMDMFMVWFIVLALRQFYLMYHEQKNFTRRQILLGVYIVLGIYSKAFMGILIPLVTILVFLWQKKELRSWSRYWSWRVWTIILAGMALWFGLVLWEAGSEYLYNLTVGQTVSRSVKVSVHKKPFYYYLIFLSYGVAPWTFFYVGSMIWGMRHHAFRSDKMRLFVIEILTTFVMLSCFGSKLAIYLLPIFPFMACLALSVLQQIRWNKWLAFAVNFPAMVLIPALPVYIIVAQIKPEFQSPLLYLATTILSVSALWSVKTAWKQKQLPQAIRIFCCGFLLTAFTGGWTLRQWNAEIGYTALATEVQHYEKEWQAEGVVTCSVWRAENMDVFFPNRLHVLKKMDPSLENTYKNHVLVIDSTRMSKEELQQISKGKTFKPIGRKYIITKL